jgi:Mitochondrial ATPase inhibitor, IATP
MMSSAAVRALRAAKTLSSGWSAQQTTVRSLAGISEGSMGGSWKSRERAAEEVYFNKEDAATLARLAAKLHKVTEVRTLDLAFASLFLQFSAETVLAHVFSLFLVTLGGSDSNLVPEPWSLVAAASFILFANCDPAHPASAGSGKGIARPDLQQARRAGDRRAVGGGASVVFLQCL